MENETSKNEILEAVSEFSTNVDKQFQEVKGEMKQIHGEMKQIHGEMKQIHGEISGLKASMVTKSYLDEKLADLRGDLVVLTRKEDTKMIKLVEILKRRAVITEAEEKEILSMEPFAKVYILNFMPIGIFDPAYKKRGFCLI